jgi:xanthine dehydrogenase small subunit
MSVQLTLNGHPMRVDDVDPHLSALNWLRRAGYTGTKEGCSEGECGACAIAVMRRNVQGQADFQAINSCLVPLAALDGHSVVTVEGVAGLGGDLHPVQRALVDKGGSQCGYCTPGFVVSMFCEYYRPGREGFDPESVSGNLCRCTGYRPILEAGGSLGPPRADDPWLARLSAPAGVPGTVQGAVTELLPGADHARGGRRFVRPTSLAEIFARLGEDPAATLIAGGTDLMVRANQSDLQFGTLLSLEAVAELRAFAWGPDALIIGAGLTLSELEARIALDPELAGELPIVRQVLWLFSSRLIRNRATLGGNLGTASPIGDSPPVLLALDAEVTLASARGRRTLPLREYFRGYRQTALGAGELIVELRLPRPFPKLQRFYKVSKRVLDDISTVAAAFALDLAADGRVHRLRIAYGGIAATPIVAQAAEELAVGRPWDAETVELLAESVGGLGTPMSDHRGSAAYRRAMTVSLLRKFFDDTTGPGAANAVPSGPRVEGTPPGSLIGTLPGPLR